MRIWISGRGVESIDPCVCNNERVENCQSSKMAAVNNETLAAIMIVDNALFNDSSDESSNEERSIFGLEPKQERCNSIPIIRNMHYQIPILINNSPVGCSFIIAIGVQDNGDSFETFSVSIFRLCFL